MNIFSNAFLINNILRPWEENDPDGLHLSVSLKNKKMGIVPSVSISPEHSCAPNIPCAPDCYARGTENYRKNSVKPAWYNNYLLWKTDPSRYFYELGMWMDDNTRFRMHVGGDCPDYQYFVDLMDTIESCPNCLVLIFTKKPQYINKFIEEGNEIPKNARIMVSKWGNEFEPYNPHNFPTSDVIFTKKKNLHKNVEHSPDSVICDPKTRTCEKCYFNRKNPDEKNCWNMDKGDQILFYEH